MGYRRPRFAIGATPAISLRKVFCYVKAVAETEHCDSEAHVSSGTFETGCVRGHAQRGRSARCSDDADNTLYRPTQHCRGRPSPS